MGGPASYRGKYIHYDGKRYTYAEAGKILGLATHTVGRRKSDGWKDHEIMNVKNGERLADYRATLGPQPESTEIDARKAMSMPWRVAVEPDPYPVAQAMSMRW